MIMLDNNLFIGDNLPISLYPASVPLIDSVSQFLPLSNKITWAILEILTNILDNEESWLKYKPAVSYMSKETIMLARRNL